MIRRQALLPALSRGPDGRWDLSGATALQERWREKVLRSGSPRVVRGVGGADVVVLDPDTLDVLDRAVWEGDVALPYVPGYLSFREAPPVLAAWERLRVRPDLLLVDGQGVAHPRRFGLACHLGLLLDVPAVGVAKSVLVGRWDGMAATRGARVAGPVSAFPSPRAAPTAWSPCALDRETADR